MVTLHPQYITDSAGQKLVVLSHLEFETLLEELDELEDIRLYDKVKTEDDGSRISLNDYLNKRKLKNV